MAGEAIPAATLILARESGAGPPQLLMVERSSSLAFAPGALVFPGGRIDPADRHHAETLSLGDGAARIAAVRETIEECGIAAGLEPNPNREQCVALQRALLTGAEFSDILPPFELRLEALTPFARWIPGHEVSRRFDTLFFIARAGTEAEPSVGSSECASATWISADEALRAARLGDAKLIYPTLKNLERLAQFASFEAILEDARRHPVTPITASVELVDGATVVTIPSGLGYPRTRDILSDVWRG